MRRRPSDHRLLPNSILIHINPFQILPLGLVVNSIYLNADGVTHDIVEGPYDSALHGTQPYKFMNTIVGRYANRVPVTQNGHTIEKNGYSATVHPVPNGENFFGAISISIRLKLGCSDRWEFWPLSLQRDLSK